MIQLHLDRPETFPSGTVLFLSPRQALLRSSFLEDLGDGLYRTTTPLYFKAGEDVGLPDCYEPEPVPEPVVEVVPEPEPEMESLPEPEPVTEPEPEITVDPDPIRIPFRSRKNRK